MEFRKTALEGVLVIEPDVFRDARGFFLETYHLERYRRGGLAEAFVQDNHSRSIRGTLRGLHAQLRRPQGKLVRAVAGEVFDLAADVRRGSPTFGRWHGEVLSADNFRQLYVPPGFVHGFYVLSENAEVEYKVTGFFDRDDEFVVAWDDPHLAIEWPLAGAPLLSERDAAAPRLADLAELPPYEPSPDQPR
jgi:dTDP-4-dehydrorhamnose 3,5-epimerase